MKLDPEAATAFVGSVLPGRWTTYGDVAAAGGSPKGAMAVGGWLMANGHRVPGVHRVLNAKGEVSDGWVAASPDLPQTAEGVRELLHAEGAGFGASRVANPRKRWTVADWRRSEAGR